MNKFYNLFIPFFIFSKKSFKNTISVKNFSGYLSGCLYFLFISSCIDGIPSFEAQYFVTVCGFDAGNLHDIPGVPGVGPKTAAQLLGCFNSLDQLLAELPAVADSGLRGAKKLANKLGEYHDQILMARKLVKLADDAPVEKSLEAFTWKRVDQDALLQFGQQMGLGKGIMRRFETLILMSCSK